MHKLILPQKENLTMSSREIAKFTGKKHSHVYRDTETMLRQLDIDFKEFV